MADKIVKIRVLEIEGDAESLRAVLGASVFTPPDVPALPEATEDEDKTVEADPEEPEMAGSVRRGRWCLDCGTGVTSKKHQAHIAEVAAAQPKSNGSSAQNE